MKQKEAYHAGTDYQFVDEVKVGPWTTYSIFHDPIHLSFVLARYKFVARILTGKNYVLEVGCGDAPGTPIVAEFVTHLVATDNEPRLIKSDIRRLKDINNLKFQLLDICKQPHAFKRFEAVYSIDVIEHLDKKLNKPFIENQVECLTPDGICIIGTPNIYANKYATHRSKVQHINLQSHQSLKEKLDKYFSNVFLFSMNDEVVHTGYSKMSHYIWAMGVGRK